MAIQNEVIELIDNIILNNVKYFPVIGTSRDMAIYIASYANSEGGYIIFGVAKVLNNLEINGLAKDFFTDKFIKGINKYFNTNPEYSWEVFQYKNRQILGFKVIKSLTDILIENNKYIIENNEIIKTKGEIIMDKTKVFIVHGHDNSAKQETARFVESLGLTAIILHEQASSGYTIIEKIEAYTNVGFAIVLYTPCDLGKAKGDVNLAARARQNVIFEHGYLIGKIGRQNVCALINAEVEKPNDISGVVYIDMDNSNGWKLLLIKEMRSAGLNIDANKLN